MPDPTDDYKDLLEKVKSWKYISVKEIREIFQVTPAEIAELVEANKNKDGTLKRTDINLTKVVEVLFGKEDETTHQRSKTND